MGLGQLYISLETSVLCEDWIYRGNLPKIFVIPGLTGNLLFCIFVCYEKTNNCIVGPLCHFFLAGP